LQKSFAQKQGMHRATPIIGGKRGSIGERFGRRPLKTTINEVPESPSSATALYIAW
jgi:hypothetical protein